MQCNVCLSSLATLLHQKLQCTPGPSTIIRMSNHNHQRHTGHRGRCPHRGLPPGLSIFTFPLDVTSPCCMSYHPVGQGSTGTTARRHSIPRYTEDGHVGIPLWMLYLSLALVACLISHSSSNVTTVSQHIRGSALSLSGYQVLHNPVLDRCKNAYSP